MKWIGRSGSKWFAAAAAIFLAAGSPVHAGNAKKQQQHGSGGSTYSFAMDKAGLKIQVKGFPALAENTFWFVALHSGTQPGSAVLPFTANREGSTVYLPFPADTLVSLRLLRGQLITEVRRWRDWRWTDPEVARDITVDDNEGSASLLIPTRFLDEPVACVVYAKAIDRNNGWGEMVACSDPALTPGAGDKYLSHYVIVSSAPDETLAEVRGRVPSPRPCIYQLFVRLFGNTNETRKENGTLEENGVGKFDDINAAAIASIKELGVTHVWLTGVLQQATATDYSKIGLAPDDPDLLKGLAGSPYAIKDYYDVCPDYAVDPAKRLYEFKMLIRRLHQAGLKVILDFVPNHVARDYASDIRPDLDFGKEGNGGKGDDTTTFFSPQNNFFYLTPDEHGPPLHLPTCRDGQPLSPTCKAIAALAKGAAVSKSPVPDSSAAGKPPPPACDGFYSGEMKFGRVTGNNVVSWTPALGDWYETVKLNYGFDFTHPETGRHFPNALAPQSAIPDTWEKMDQVLDYWQSYGVDGFRCDMAYWVPPEFWSWAISRARARSADVFFIAEAYNNDPSRVRSTHPVITHLNGGNPSVMIDLLNAGFNAVYDDPSYKALKKAVEGPGWANDLDDALPEDFISDNSLRYAENHDEVRLASPQQWNGAGPSIGVPVSALLFGLSRGPAMIYNGQEVGEPGAGREGFGQDDSRTSIFDYWSMPEMVKWVNGHKYDGGRLDEKQRTLRENYGKLLRALQQPALRDGNRIALNPLNRDNPDYGRSASETASGHWIQSFLRWDPVTKQTVLVIANLSSTQGFQNLKVRTPAGLSEMLPHPAGNYKLVDLLRGRPDVPIKPENIRDHTLPVPDLPPMSAAYYEIRVADAAK